MPMPWNDDSLRSRIILVTTLLLLAFVTLGGYLYTVQIVRHDELYAKAKKKYTSTRESHGQRGEIYDFHGNLLVGNRPAYYIQLDPSLLTNDHAEYLAGLFSRYLDLDYKKLLRKFNLRTRQAIRDGQLSVAKNRYAHVHSKVPLNLGQILKEKIQEKNASYKALNKKLSKEKRKLKKEKNFAELKKIKFKKLIRGVQFKAVRVRYYPKDNMLANVLGFTFIDHRTNTQSAFGLERHYNKALTSQNQVDTFERSRKGRPLHYGNRKVKTTVDNVGLNIIMTIREPIQSIVEEELDKLVAKWNPKAAWAILADPQGNVLAMAQRPSFNPNDRRGLTPEKTANIIMRANFEPGSTMKPIVISKALDLGFVTPRTVFYCEKGYWPLYKLRDSHPYEDLTVSEIIQKSSNIGTAKITLKMGEKNLFKTLRSFGFGKRTGIEIGLENIGILRPIRTGDGMTIARLPIGQAFNVSPLQLVRAYCALANHGKLPSMRLIDRLENKTAGIVKKISNPPPVQLYKNPNTWAKIIAMMKLVTREGGTAKQAAIKGYSVAGKTGTSQKIVDGTYSHSKYYASFIGFVPAENPAFVLLVSANEPKKSHYGGTVAAPTFRNIATRVLKNMNIKPTRPEELTDTE
jgi:cell division protein FtsI (penicillin-binding protein 3)